MNDLAVIGAGSLEAVPVSANAIQAMQAAEVDIQIATAHKFPRSISKFIKNATDMVTFDRATAAACIYRRPVGKEGGKMKFVEGESIRMAEIVAASYQNLRIASIITEVNGREVKACAMCHDLENNVAIRAETIESTLTKEGNSFSDRMQLVVAKAAQSKAIRDAIFRIVPKAMCKSIKQAAEETALGKNKSLAERRTGVMAWIQEIGVPPENVFDALGIEGIEELGRSALIDLVGIRTAIDNGDLMVKDAFPDPKKDLPAQDRTKFGPRTAKSAEAPTKKAGSTEGDQATDEAPESTDGDQEEAATDGQDGGGDLTLPDDFDETDVSPDPTGASSVEEQTPSTTTKGQPASSAAEPAKQTATGQGDAPAYHCTKCKGTNIKIKRVRGKDTPFCMDCISGKNVVDNK